MIIQAAPSLLAVTDGAASNPNMTFGWVLAHPNGTRLVKGYGRCNSRASTSMPAEAATRMLAASIFLGMLQKYTNFYFQTLQVKFMEDNDGLVCKEVEHLAHTHPNYPNTDQNLILQRKSMLHHINIIILELPSSMSKAIKTGPSHLVHFHCQPSSILKWVLFLPPSIVKVLFLQSTLS